MNLFIFSNSDAQNGDVDAADKGADFCSIYFCSPASASAQNRPARFDLSIVDGAEMPSGMARPPRFFSARAEAARGANMDYGDMLICGGAYWDDEGFDAVF